MELLSAKVVIREEAPKIRSAPSLPTAVLGIVGVTERGPLDQTLLVTSWGEYVSQYGNYITDSDVPLAVHSFFINDGKYLYMRRICHFTDVDSPSSFTAVKASRMLQTDGGGATAGAVVSSNSAPFELADGDTLDITTDLGGPTTATFNGTAPSVTDTTSYPVGPGTGVLQVKVDQGSTQSITFAGTETTADDIAATINAQIEGARAIVVAGPQVKIESDKKGTGGYVEIVANPSANPLLTFSTSEVQGGGNVADIEAVTGAEVKSVVEGAVSGVEVSGDTYVTIARSDTGSTKYVTVAASSTADDEMGFDNLQHDGTDDSPQDTLNVEGKTEGTYAHNVKTKVEDASNGDSDYFNFYVLEDDIITERFPDVTMEDEADPRYVETIVNDEDNGSMLIQVEDQELAGTRRPANQTSSALAGGDDGLTSLADVDYIGSEAGKTGLYAFDIISDITLIAVPGIATSGVQNAMITYCDTHRSGMMHACLDPPASQTALQMKTYVETTASLKNLSEHGFIWWPRIKVVNPNETIYGNEKYVVIPPAASLAGVMARNDSRGPGGIAEAPAGIEYGLIKDCVGLETDEALDPKKRDLVYPALINPITKIGSSPYHSDGSRTLKENGNWPSIGQRRLVTYIERVARIAVLYAKHRNITRRLKNSVEGTMEQFLLELTSLGVFASTKPREAFWIDVSDELNPPSVAFARQVRVRIGLATAYPGEFIIISFSQDLRALEQALLF